ncbi:hypothetical protein, partial [Algoriphagus boritolerans]
MLYKPNQTKPNQTKPNQTKPLFSLFGILIAVLMGWLATSCIEEEIEQVSELKNSEIEAAKSWYDAFEMQNQGDENARKVKNGKGKPDWSKSKVYHQSDGKKVIEVQF